MPRQNRIHDLRYHRVFVADDARKDAGVIAISQAGNEIVPEFILHAAGAQPFFGKGTVAQFAERARKTHENPRYKNTFLDYTRKSAMLIFSSPQIRKPKPEVSARVRCRRPFRERERRDGGWE